MKTSDKQKPVKTWEKTSQQNLVRHKSGRYYARTFANNKEIWKSLKTSHFSIAKAKLAEFLRDHRAKQVATEAAVKMTFAQALKIHQQHQVDDVTIKASTRHYWNQIFTALLKSWPGLADREVRRIMKTDCTEWARKFRKAGSPTRYNNTISGLRHVFSVAIDAGVMYGNPAEKLERVPECSIKLSIRSRPKKGQSSNRYGLITSGRGSSLFVPLLVQRNTRATLISRLRSQASPTG